MSTVFKKFSKSDVSITPFTAHKQTTLTKITASKAELFDKSSTEFHPSNPQGKFVSASFPTVAYKSGTGFEWAGSGNSNDPNNHKKYFQLDHLFYKNSKLDYGNKFSKIKYSTDTRVLYERVNILSLPYKTIGYKIKPGSFMLSQSSTGERIVDDSKGNLILTTFPFNHSDYSQVDDKFRIFYLGPVEGYKYYNLGIKDGKEVVNIPSSYSKKGALDDSYLFNEIEYKNVTFETGSTGEEANKAGGNGTISYYSKIEFNGENSTVISPHNSRLNFNSDDDFSINFKLRAADFTLASGINDNEKRYIISKSTTKTVIKSPNLANNTQITGSSQGVDVDAEPQFPFEIYWQSQSLYFKRSDGNTTSEISASIDTYQYESITCIKTGSTLQIFNREQKRAEGTDNTTQCQNQANLYIGSKGGISNFWTGSIEQIMIYEKALRGTDLKTLMWKPDGPSDKIGNIFYNNGLVAITNPSYHHILNPTNYSNPTITYQGTHLIYENEYQCMAEQYEFDVTLNPSARKIRSKDSEDLANFATGSNFKPYVTTVGLYNDNGELLVIGKLGQPIRMSDEADTTYVVRFDT